jgi:hypothetical protein
MLPGAEGIDELDVHHLGAGFLGQFKYVFGCAHAFSILIMPEMGNVGPTQFS